MKAWRRSLDSIRDGSSDKKRNEIIATDNRDDYNRHKIKIKKKKEK